ncbi:hypothetical protein DIPPA_15007 [Diplonema papillatum]|nr:hypothetical protein DIPPA_15007 [Diplonema papillatum]
MSAEQGAARNSLSIYAPTVRSCRAAPRRVRSSMLDTTCMKAINQSMGAPFAVVATMLRSCCLNFGFRSPAPRKSLPPWIQVSADVTGLTPVSGYLVQFFARMQPAKT